jgi:hypothetical protein
LLTPDLVCGVDDRTIEVPQEQVPTGNDRLVSRQVQTGFSAASTRLPEIDAGAEPVVFVPAGLEVLLASENGFGEGLVTAVKAEDKGGEHRVHD